MKSLRADHGRSGSSARAVTEMPRTKSKYRLLQIVKMPPELRATSWSQTLGNSRFNNNMGPLVAYCISRIEKGKVVPSVRGVTIPTTEEWRVAACAYISDAIRKPFKAQADMRVIAD